MKIKDKYVLCIYFFYKVIDYKNTNNIRKIPVIFHFSFSLATNDASTEYISYLIGV